MQFKIFLSVVFICVNILTVIAQDNKLEIVGTVIGKDRLFGHIYDSNAVNTRLLIIRVDEKLKGKIDSKYILIDYLWHLSDKDTPYETNNATQWKFNLTRKKDCDSTLERIQFSYYSIDNKITGMFPSIDRSWGIALENLPFAEILPCYQLKSENLSKIETFQTDSNKIPRTDTEFFVLKDSFLINLPQAPLEIEIIQNGLFAFTNKSDKTITNYTFGCVIKKINGIKITNKFSSKAVDLPRNLSIATPRGSGGGGMSDYSEQVKTCYDKKSKLSIVKVVFDDKSVWQAN